MYIQHLLVRCGEKPPYKTILKVSVAVVNADLTVLDRRFSSFALMFSVHFSINGSGWFFCLSGADVGAVAKTSPCQRCRIWSLTDNFDNYSFGRNIATGKSCRIFLATTSKILPPAFSFSSSRVKLKMGHELFLLHVRFSRELQALTIIKQFELEDKV